MLSTRRAQPSGASACPIAVGGRAPPCGALVGRVSGRALLDYSGKHAPCRALPEEARGRGVPLAGPRRTRSQERVLRRAGWSRRTRASMTLAAPRQDTLSSLAETRKKSRGAAPSTRRRTPRGCAGICAAQAGAQCWKKISMGRQRYPQVDSGPWEMDAPLLALYDVSELAQSKYTHLSNDLYLKSRGRRSGNEDFPSRISAPQHDMKPTVQFADKISTSVYRACPSTFHCVTASLNRAKCSLQLIPHSRDEFIQG